MRIIPWRVENFFNRRFHKLYMLVRFRTTNLNTRAHWDRRFGQGDYRESNDTGPVFDAMAELVPKGGRVLDVGIGTGRLARLLKKTRTPEVYGLDISSVAIEGLKRDGIDGVSSELPEIPYPDEYFDAVTAKALLEHLPETEDSIAAMVRVLQPGGRLLISVPDDILGPEDEPEHFRKYNSNSLRAELARHVRVDDIRSLCGTLLAACTKANKRT